MKTFAAIALGLGLAVAAPGGPARAQALGFEQARLCVHLGSAINDFQLAIASIRAPILAGRTTDVSFAARVDTLTATAKRFDLLFEEARFLLPVSTIDAQLPRAESDGSSHFGQLETAWSIADLEVGQVVALHARKADLSQAGDNLRKLADLLGNPLDLQKACSNLFLGSTP